MNRRRIRLALLAGLTVMLTWMISAALAAAPGVSFRWTVDGKEVSVRLFEKKKDQSLVLFVPGALKGRDPVVITDGKNDLVWGEETYSNGSVFPAEKYLNQPAEMRLSNNQKKYTVTVMEGSRIPAMFFNVDKTDLKRVTNQYKRINKKPVDIKEKADLVMLAGDGSINAAENITSFKTHGNSTFFASKKPYQFKMEHKADLAGMQKNKTWILLANWFDISLIRNQITYDLCREVGLTSTPDCRQVELYVNGDYYGTYLLSEKIQLKKGRVEITDLEETLEELNGKGRYDAAKFKQASGKGICKIMNWFNIAEEPEDVTGGYLLEIEKSLQFSMMEDGAGFVTDDSMCVVVKEPTHAGRKEVEYIAALVNDFHKAVLKKDGVSPKTGKHYSDYIDMKSFALKIAVEEFCANYDVRAASQFMYKDKDSVDSLIYAGPGWDYDLTYGVKDDGIHNPLKEDFVLTRASNKGYLYHWLLTHDDFKAVTRKYYDEVFLPAAEVLAGRREPKAGSPLKSVAAYQDEIRESAAMNFTRWTAKAIPDVWDKSGRTFEDSGAFVIDWIDQRLDMMTEKWLAGEVKK